jgi:DNA-binding beta-propeller fold protein YncE
MTCRSHEGWLRFGVIGLAITLAAACTGESATPTIPTNMNLTQTGVVPPARSSPPTASSPPSGPERPRLAPPFRHPLPGMPPVIGNDVYGAAGSGMLSPKVADDPAYLYVPNSFGAPHTTVIDQRTHKIVRVLHTGTLSQHVTPSWDLKTLYVEASGSNELVSVDPDTGRINRRIPVRRPYNLYFTPDGRQAIVMSEEDNLIIFTDPRTFRPRATVTDRTCNGPNHADFSGNGRYFVVTCEFSGSLLRISTLRHHVTGRLNLGPGSQPQDVRLSPDGRVFYVADMGRDRLTRISWRGFRRVGYTPMPSMPHGIYPSRDGSRLYVSDRGAGEVSVVSLATNKIVDTWTIPGGGSPDMGGVSADGKMLWLSGRYDGRVYGWNTRTGRLVARITVGGSPHGLAVWPQPGRYSLGHTGNMR